VRTVYCVGFESEGMAGFEWLATAGAADALFAEWSQALPYGDTDGKAACYRWDMDVPDELADGLIVDFIYDHGEYVTYFDLPTTRHAGDNFGPRLKRTAELEALGSQYCIDFTKGDPRQ
jgi:hypothetical protein